MQCLDAKSKAWACMRTCLAILRSTKLRDDEGISLGYILAKIAPLRFDGRQFYYVIFSLIPFGLKILPLHP